MFSLGLAALLLFVAQLDASNLKGFLSNSLSYNVSSEGSFNEFLNDNEAYRSLNLYLIMTGSTFAVLSITLFLCRTRFRNWLKQVFVGLTHILDFIIAGFRKLTTVQVIALCGSFLILAIVRLYFAHIVPLKIDELFVYNEYGSKNPFVALLSYQLPSNHILHTFSSRIFSELFMMNSITGMRYFSIFIGFLSSAVMFGFLMKEFKSFAIALVVTLLFSSFHAINYGSVIARGYILNVFFTQLCVIAICRYKRNRQFYSLLFVSCSILGFYTITSFLYNYIVLFVFGLINQQGDRRKWIIQMILMSGLVTIGTLLLYVPVMIINGVDAVILETRDYSVVLERFWYKLGHSSEWVIGPKVVSWCIMILLLGHSGFQLFKRHNSTWSKLLIVSIIAVPAITLIHGMLIPGRVWSFIAIPVAIFIASLLSNTSRQQIVFLSGGLLVAIILNLNLTMRRSDHITYFDNGKNAISYLMDRDYRNVRFEDSYFQELFLYYSRNQSERSSRISEPTDYVITKTKNSTMNISDEKYQEVFKNPDCRIYRRRPTELFD